MLCCVKNVIGVSKMTPEQIQRFMSKVIKTGNCWEWLGYKNKAGYGRFNLDGKVKYTHRVSYERFKGDIPQGLFVDHLCRNPACVNPDQLEIVTHKENILRGIGITSKNKQKTHCIRGHELKGDNLYINPRQERQCVECHRTNVREKYHIRKLGVNNE